MSISKFTTEEELETINKQEPGKTERAMKEQGEIILYQPDDEVKLEVRLENETVWLSIEEMSQLYGRGISVIGKHIRNVFKEGELLKESVWAKFV